MTDRATLHRLLHPWFRVDDDGRQVTMEVSKSALAFLLLVPLMLGYVPLFAILVYLQQWQFLLLFPLLAGVPSLFLFYLVASLWRQRVCLAFNRHSREFIVPECSDPIAFDNVQSLTVRLQSPRGDEQAYRPWELVLIAASDGTERQHFIASGARGRLRRTATMIAACTGITALTDS